jgi:hypothetical protein
MEGRWTLYWEGSPCVRIGFWIKWKGEDVKDYFLLSLQGRGEVWYSFSQGSESATFAENGMLDESARWGEDERWSREKETEKLASVTQDPRYAAFDTHPSSVSRFTLFFFAISLLAFRFVILVIPNSVQKRMLSAEPIMNFSCSYRWPKSTVWTLMIQKSVHFLIIVCTEIFSE